MLPGAVLPSLKITNHLREEKEFIWCIFKSWYLGFPAGSSGKESACQCRRHGFNPWSRKIPLSPCTTTTEPVLWSLQLLALHTPEPVLHKRSHRNEKSSYVNQRSLLATTGVKPVQQERRRKAINK